MSSKPIQSQPSSITIRIDANYQPDQIHSAVANGGTVDFIVTPSTGCTICTVPAAAFQGQTGSCLQLAAGNPPGNNLTVNISDATITYCACAAGQTCNPLSSRADGGNTIQVGSGGASGKGRR
jgi:hypothetical protein